MKRYHVIVDGRVQGVGFRYHTQLSASERNLTGWVRNKTDGAVELEVQGNTDQINSLLSSLENARFPAKVEKVITKEIETKNNEESFSICS
ncbi:acylphosphatase [Salipaludibacillus keqinensis]|uniref:Acylphosphatase n=1 Tax=Salipaludibacillus keqinensis TaxID=2045207 RepID=A0A323T9L2_9BACI|nr:acylphosphatase [Salipaludibacillus keqinensis]PYZ92362.1 acylphosphatase [Salipaludibacillus keqinensis]